MAPTPPATTPPPGPPPSGPPPAPAAAPAPASPAAASPPPRPATPRGRALRWALWSALGVLLLAALVGGIGWVATTQPGVQWGLGRVPGLQVEGLQGSFGGGPFAAKRLHYRQGELEITIDDLRWRDLRWRLRPREGSLAGLVIEAPSARRVEVRTGPASAPGAPAQPPASLRLPVELELRQAAIDELHIDDQAPLTELRAELLHLGQDNGLLHRVRGLRANRDGLALAADGSIGAIAPMAVELQARVRNPDDAGLPWLAELNAKGPLARLELGALWHGASAAAVAAPAGAPASAAAAAAASASASAARDPGTLRIDATLTPFAAWPLAALVANAQALDLSAFNAALPQTRLSGKADVHGSGAKEPLQVALELANALPGRLDASRLPIAQATLLLRGVPSDLRTVEFERLQLQLADGPAADAGGTAGAAGATARSGAASTRHAAGRIDGSGRWHGDQLELSLQLDGVRPDRLDSRAAPMTLAGPLRLAVGGLPAPDGTAAPAGSALVATLGGELEGALAQNAGGPLPRTRLEIDAQAEGREGAWTVELGKLVARAADASARGSARIELAADGAWRLRSSGKLDRFDPRPWFPGAPGSAWRRGPHRLDADWKLDLSGAATAPAATTAAAVATPPTPKPTRPTQPTPTTTAKRADASPFDALLALRGEAALDLRPSQLAGVPLRGKLALRNPAGATEAVLDLDLRAADNHIVASGRLRHARDAGCRAAGQQAAAACFSDRWQLDIDAPTLAQLRPIVALHPALANYLPSAGAAQAKISAVGRWPLLRSEGTLQASGVKAGAVELGRVDGRWRIGSDADAPLELRLDGASLAYGENRLTSLQARVDGSLREQRFELDATSSARPPAWVDSVDVRRASDREAAAAATAPTVAQASPVAVAAAEQGTRLRVAGSGRFDPQQRLWQGLLAELRASDLTARQPAWLAARELRPSLRFDADGGLREALLQPGQLELLGAPLRWREARWQAGAGGAAPARLDLDAELAPLRVAPWLARFQPDLRWGGDLAIGGRAVVRSAAQFDADVVIERSGGDLTITDETGTESLGLTDLRLALAAHGGTWYFTQAVAGANLGVLAGSQVLRVPASSSWPAPTTPLEGVLEWRVDNLAVWAPWVPASWRLGGKLRTSASFGGSFGAPQLTGEMAGSGLSARNLLEGIDLRDGDLAITLRGETARIERLRLRGGDGELVIGGGATLGAAPRAQLQIDARRFQLLGRLDRRIITSGRAELRFDADALKLDGSFAIDEGLFDFTRSDAPSLDSDIVVVRRRGEAPRTPDQLAAERAKAAPPPKRSTDVQLRVDLGDKLLLRGRGIDTRLRGHVAITTPQGRLAVNGAVRTEGGTYAAYGQKLEIRRGVVAFSGVPDNPRLDIVAVRPNLDVDVGVAVSGTALNPRVRLFSEPDMNDMDKLSWLLLGRAPDGLGRNDSALLQRAAMALMAGEGASKTDELIKRLGLDEISVRQTEASGQTAGETIVSLGKQISSRLYLGYEHGVNSATGNWQLIYRIAQRLTLRAQAGSDSAVDVIRSWRWN